MWKILLYTATGVLLSEVIYILYKFAKKSKKSENEDENDDENRVDCVIWTNELTLKCFHVHNFQNESTTPVRNSNATKDRDRCENPYCANANIGSLVRFVDSAKHSIDLAMYTFTSFEMSNALHRALRRDVIVRIITDKEMAFSSGSQVTMLGKLGAPVRHPLGSNSSLMHHKFCIIDGVNRVSRIMEIDQKEFDPKSVKSILFSGSLNWTQQALNSNWENVIITSNKSLVKQFEKEFERMWIAFGVEEFEKSS